MHLAVDHDSAGAIGHRSDNLLREGYFGRIGREHPLGDRHLIWMQRPSTGAAHEEAIAELHLASSGIGYVAERPIKRLDARGGTGIDHFRGRVVPEVLLISRARRIGGAARNGIGHHFVFGMAAADARCFHRPRCRQVRRTEADAVHPRRSARDRRHIVDALGGFQDGMNEDRLLHRVLGLKLRQKLIEIMDVPGAFDFRQHDDVEFLADRADDLTNVVEHPG